VIDFIARLGPPVHDPADPDPYLALYLDQSLPLDPQAKAALVLDARSFSRRVLLPILRPFCRLFLVLVALFRLLVPRAFTSSRLLHRLIHLGLARFVSPQASFLILRHFHLGADVAAFLAANAPVAVASTPLRPLGVGDVREDLFLRHDLALYNLVIALNLRLREAGQTLQPPPEIDFSPLHDGPIPFEPFAERWTNVLDATLAIELYTPLYHLLLGQRDFARASLSLQLDETVAIYAAQLLGDSTHLALVNNRHPLVPLSSLAAGFRLILHGLGTEVLHAVLLHHKRAQAAGRRPAGGLGGLWAAR
jgi:hypothetical protein